MELVKKNILGFDVDDKDPNAAWPMPLAYDDVNNDRWLFTNGIEGWTRIEYQDNFFHFMAAKAPELNGRIYQYDLTPSFMEIGYGIDMPTTVNSIADILLDGWVMPIKNGFIFVISKNRDTSFIFVPDTDRRLDDIKRMRNKRTEILMNLSQSTPREEILRFGGFMQ